LAYLRNVIVSRYVTFDQINKFLFIGIVFIIDKVSLRARWNGFAGRIWPGGCCLETPVLDQKS